MELNLGWVTQTGLSVNQGKNEDAFQDLEPHNKSAFLWKSLGKKKTYLLCGHKPQKTACVITAAKTTPEDQSLDGRCVDEEAFVSFEPRGV